MDLAATHPELPGKTIRVDITRYGHAMAVPVRAKLWIVGLQPPSSRRYQLHKTERTGIAHRRLEGDGFRYLRNRASDNANSTEPISNSASKEVHTTSSPAPRYRIA